MSDNRKDFDAVAMMRAGRDEMSASIQGMTLEEELEWIAAQPIDDPFLIRLRDKAISPSAAAHRLNHPT